MKHVELFINNLLEAMFDDLEYYTDGINWLPCGVEI